VTNNSTKNQIIAEFAAIKNLEECAYELYTKAASDPQISDNKIRKVFEEIAADEKRHIELVQKIIDIVSSKLL
jgi:rubrerythrin